MEDIILPDHIAFIMDGNGRWATAKKLPRSAGHIEGVKTVERIIEWLCERKIKCCTFYAFSTENWARPLSEIEAIQKLLIQYCDKILARWQNNPDSLKGVSFRFIGDTSVFSELIRDRFLSVEKISAGQSEINTIVNIAVNYGGRSEIVRAVNSFIMKNPGKMITEKDVSDYTYLYGIQDPDLIIRTAGEHRLSNFLTWESIYSEFYSTEVLWPDFTEKDLIEAINVYHKRVRKFGGIVK